jgi:uncharacterized ParB-like nuclease family protein
LPVKRGIVPEQLPPAEDIKKIESRVEAGQKRLPQQVKRLESDEANTNEQSPSLVLGIWQDRLVTRDWYAVGKNALLCKPAVTPGAKWGGKL